MGRVTIWSEERVGNRTVLSGQRNIGINSLRKGGRSYVFQGKSVQGGGHSWADSPEVGMAFHVLGAFRNQGCHSEMNQSHR